MGPGGALTLVQVPKKIKNKDFIKIESEFIKEYSKLENLEMNIF